MKTSKFLSAALLVAMLGMSCSKDDDAGNTKTIRGIETVLIPAGTFMMGSPETENGRDSDETQHQVTLTKSFYMSKYEITNAQYCAFLNDAGVGEDGMYTFSRDLHVEAGEYRLISSDGDGVQWNNTDSKWEPAVGYENHPVIYVTWYGAYAYAKWAGGSLPTEAQWEYACRAGSTTAYCFGDDESDLGDYAWYGKNSGNCTHPVGLKLPNAWGLYDMHGNVWEWCLDWYGDYGSDPVTDPTGPATSDERVNRGGSWNNAAAFCRSAIRYYSTPAGSIYYIGFRVVFSL